MSYTDRNHHKHTKRLGIYGAGVLILMLVTPTDVSASQGQMM